MNHVHEATLPTAVIELSVTNAQTYNRRKN